MLCLTRQVEYALIALAHLADGRSGGVASARQIAEAHALPPSLVAKILKGLQANDWLESTRGVNGGYRLRSDLEAVTLHDLIVALGQSVMPTVSDLGGRHQPVRALQYKLVRFLTDVRISDLVMPGRRIDVPFELLARPRAVAGAVASPTKN